VVMPMTSMPHDRHSFDSASVRTAGLPCSPGRCRHGARSLPRLRAVRGRRGQLAAQGCANATWLHPRPKNADSSLRPVEELTGTTMSSGL
jgi:hypothetical protein